MTGTLEHARLNLEKFVPCWCLVQRHLSNTRAVLGPRWNLPGAGWRDEGGSVSLMTAMLGVFLIGIAAIAVDVGNWEGNSSTMQGAADQAALAASMAMTSGNPAAQKEAKGLAAAYGFMDGVGGVSVAVNIPPATGSHTSIANAIEVVITQPQGTFLSGAILSSGTSASARAVAAPTGPTGPAPATCIVALAATGTSLIGSGASVINAGTCNVYVNSPSACDVNLSASASITGFNVFLGEASLGMMSLGQGSCIGWAARLTATGSLKLSAASVADPYSARTMPIPTTPCKAASLLPTNTTLGPGTYCSLVLTGVQNVTLTSGVYIFDGGDVAATASSKITGNNVTLVLTSSGATYGQLYVNGAASITLTPMTYGPTAGMAVWLDKKGSRPITVSGSGALNVTGAVDAPASAVVWSGAATSPCTQLIASTINFSGSASFQHNCTGFGVSDMVGLSTGYKLAE